MITTATSTIKHDFAANRLLQGLVLICAAVWIWAAIAPSDRMDWLLENILLIVGAALVVVIDRTRPFSDLSHILLALFFVLHAVGSHYTYSEVPAGFWLKEVFDLDRNPYDRIVHFCWGFLLAYPARELVMRNIGLRGFAAYFVTFAAMVASSEIYELIEWSVATLISPETAMAFLGTQGDPFDAQKDTALALAGTVITLAVTKLLERRA